MCSNTCSGCHSLSDCTFLYKYGYETITVTINQSRSEEIEDTLIDKIILNSCALDYVIVHQDSRLMSSFMNDLLKKYDMKIKTVALYNQSLCLIY